MKLNPIIIIPARMASTRLPNKPLARIKVNGIENPMIVHVSTRAHESKAGEVYVACADKVIADVVEKANTQAVMTDPGHPSGTDRIFEALEKIDKEKKFDVVVNLQGDLPNIKPEYIRNVIKPLENPDVDIATLACEITDKAKIENPNVVKVVVDFSKAGKKEPVVGTAISFSRVPEGNPPFFHHIGIYAYKRNALEKFTRLPQSESEKKEKLEQLRAMDNGMRIDVVLVDEVPYEINTKEDLIETEAKAVY